MSDKKVEIFYNDFDTESLVSKCRFFRIMVEKIGFSHAACNLEMLSTHMIRIIARSNKKKENNRFIDKLASDYL